MTKGRPKPPDWWKELMTPRFTPDNMKTELSGERFAAGTNRRTKRWLGRKVKTRIDVEEPLMEIIDSLMEKEGVSDGRMERALGLYDKKIKDMRMSESQWRILKLARQMLWAMGYDLQMKVIKRSTPDKMLVMTNTEIELRKKKGLTDWDMSRMWKYLGMDKLP